MSKIKVLFVGTIWASGWNHIQKIEKRRLDQKTRSLMVNDTLPEGYETKMVRTLESGEEQVICISNYFPSQEAAQQFIDDKIKSGKFGKLEPVEPIKGSLKPSEVIRDENGYWTHPELLEALKVYKSEFATNAEWLLFKQQQNIETSFVTLEYDAPESVQIVYADGGIDISGWNPTKPEGDGWFMLSIHDTDNGAVCFWAKSLEPVEGGSHD